MLKQNRFIKLIKYNDFNMIINLVQPSINTLIKCRFYELTGLAVGVGVPRQARARVLVHEVRTRASVLTRA